jgi:hypothetical protein
MVHVTNLTPGSASPAGGYQRHFELNVTLAHIFATLVLYLDDPALRAAAGSGALSWILHPVSSIAVGRCTLTPPDP